MSKIINLTQHSATQEQKNAGVFDLEGEASNTLKRLLTFETIPTHVDLVERASQIVQLVLDNTEDDVRQAMIGGAPYFMPYLQEILRTEAIIAIYSFTTRVSSEETQPDGSVKKVNVFRHIGFVTPF